MFSNKLGLLLCGALLAGSTAAAIAQSPEDGFRKVIIATVPNTTFSIPTQALAALPGMVPMIVYVPAQQMPHQSITAPFPPHSHAPAAQSIEATHCSINDVDVLTQDSPSCAKAGGQVVAERASFANSPPAGDWMP